MAKAKGKRSAGSKPSSSKTRSARHDPVARLWTAGLLAVGLVAFGVYANALSNGFVWDDPIILERQLVVFDSVADVLITPRGIPHYSPDYYRPTTTASYLLDRTLGGNDPFYFHLSVVLLHAVVSVLVSVLCRQLLCAAPYAAAAALVAGVVFAVHPVHTESVAWAAGRSDVLACLFTLAVLLTVGRGPAGAARVVASGVWAFAALGAKEVAVVLYPLLLLRDWLDPEIAIDRRSARRYAGVVVALIAYLILRRLTIGEVVGQQPGESAALTALPSMFWALGGYARELLWPFPLNAYIDVVPSGIASLAGSAMLAAALVWGVLRWRAGDWPWLYAALWIPIAIAPSLAILWKIPEVPMAERYTYLPSVGFALLIGIAAARLTEGRDARRLLLGAPLVVLAAISVWLRNPVWHDDIRLWSDTVGKTEVSGMAWRSLGAAYLRAGRDDDAEAPLRRALELRNPPLGTQGIYSNLGTIEMRKQRFQQARELYEQAVAGGATDPDAIFNLGLSILYAGDQTEAAARESLPYFQRAAVLSPHDPDIDAVLGQVYSTLGDKNRAATHLRAALEKDVRPETRPGVEQMLRGLEKGGE